MRDDGDEMAGLMNARRCGGARYGDEQAVTICVRGVEVQIRLSEGLFPAGLTPVQARFVARALYRMARLADQRAGVAATVVARKEAAA